MLNYKRKFFRNFF